MASTRSARQVIPAGADRRAIAGVPAASIGLDWAMAICTCVITFGLYIDGWAHNHDKVDDTFFTPWHAVLYGAVLAAGLLLIFAHFRNVGRGYRWRQALPVGYGLSLAGFFIFAAGGVADLIWHEAFGFEKGLEALLSPSHLLLAASGLMIMTGPIRAMWRRDDIEQSWRGLLPAILVFACVTSVFTFFTTFAAVSSEFIALTGARPEDHTLTDVYGIMSLVMHANLLLAVVLFMARRWRLPIGAVTLLYVINMLLMTWMHVLDAGDFIFVVSAGAAGLLGDWLLRLNALDKTGSFRFFAISLPFVFCLGALLMTHILGASVWGGSGLWWEIHMWLGAPLMAAAFGYGLSMVMRPPVADGKA